MKRMDLTSPAHAEMYVHETQGGYTSLGTARLVVRVGTTATDRRTAAATVRAAVAELDPTLPVERIEPMADLLADSMSRTRFAARLVLAFSFLALLTTALGLYSAISYAATTRRRELALRMAVGATLGQVLRRRAGGDFTRARGGCRARVRRRCARRPASSSGRVRRRAFRAVRAGVGGGRASATVLAAAHGPVRRTLGLDPARVLSGD